MTEAGVELRVAGDKEQGKSSKAMVTVTATRVESDGDEDEEGDGNGNEGWQGMMRVCVCV